MKKILYFPVLLFLLVACSSSSLNSDFSSSNFYELNLLNEKTFFLEYPRGAVVEEEAGEGTLLYQNCVVNFSSKHSSFYKNFHALSVGYDADIKSLGSIDYEAWFLSDSLSSYIAVLNDFDYVFWLYNENEDVSSCINLLEYLAEHFTDKPLYVNEKYFFAVELLLDYKLEYLADDGGLIMKHWVEAVGDFAAADYVEAYSVEILLTAYENSMDYIDLNDLLIKKYSDYDVEFVEFENFSGFFINEGAVPDALIRFLTMSDDNSIIYEAYLKIPSIHYSNYKDFFTDFLMGMEFF